MDVLFEYTTPTTSIIEPRRYQWIYECKNKQMNERMNKWMNGWMDELVYENKN